MSDPQDQAEALDEDVVDPESDRTGDVYGDALAGFPPEEPLGVDDVGTTPVEEDAGESFAERTARLLPDTDRTSTATSPDAAPEELAMHVERRTDRPPAKGGRLDLDHSNVTAERREPEPTDTSERGNGSGERAGAPPGDVPNETEAEDEFEHTDAESLREAKELTDDDGDDIRHYSGEPVPTEHGNVIPQQMAVGRDAVVGDGEWPEEPPRGDENSDT